MYLKLTASSDSYITNKILSPGLRAEDANVGQASTIDLFKLYSESKFTGEENPIELSRGLIKFNLNSVSASIKDKASMAHPSFKCTLHLKDVQGGQVAPSDFNLIVYPLALSWDEGLGRDIYSFNDLDRVNWVTASYSSSTNNLWNTSGSKAEGLLDSNDIDIIGSGAIGDGDQEYLYSTQYFETGQEDLKVDVTTIVSGTIAGFIPDNGFLIAFSGSEETDTKSRFVKRFASRHVANPYLQPELIVEWDDAIIDNRKNLNFDTSGSLFLVNYRSNNPGYLVSGSSSVTSDLLIKLSTGSWYQWLTASAHKSSDTVQPGYYSASFAISSSDSATTSYSTSMYNHILSSGSITFGEQWYSMDNTVKFFSGSIKVFAQNTGTSTRPRDLRFSVIDLKSKYKNNSQSQFRLFVRDKNLADEPVRIPIQLPSIVLNEVYYQIKDAYNNKVLIPFRKEDTTNSTRVSSDSEGMYFNVPLQILPENRFYTVELLVIERGLETIYETSSIFEVIV